MNLFEKKILMLVDSFPPSMSMNGVVMYNIANYLDSSNDINIISLKQSKNDVRTFRDNEIIYVKTISYKINLIREKIHATNCILLRIFLLFIRIISLLERMFSPIGINIITRHRLTKNITSLLRKKHYDYIICNAKPFENIDAIFAYYVATKKKKDGTCLIAYQTDDFITAGDERYIPQFIIKWHKKNRKKRLGEYLKLFSRYYMLNSVYSKEAIFNDTHSSIRPIGIPLLENRTLYRKINNDSKNLTFTGSLVKEFRPPNDALKTLLEVSKDLNFTLHIYHKGDCENDIIKFENISNNTIINHGTVDTKTAYQAMSNADFLISISNIAGDQISGKTFDYISTGKPIIHFYYNPNDMNKNVLKNYRLALCIQLVSDENNCNVAKIANFINTNAGEFISYNEILDCYHDYSIDVVVNELFSA